VRSRCCWPRAGTCPPWPWPLAAGTAGGLLLSTRVALFGFRESLAAQDAVLSLVLEAAATVVLLLLALAAPARDRDAGRRDARPRATSR
jgi:hypothetical protein